MAHSPDYSELTRRLSSQGVAALELAVARHKRPVRGAEIEALWEEANGEPLEPRRRGRMTRILAPDITDGDVRTHVIHGRVFFVLKGPGEPALPRYTSDTARLQKAVRLAVSRHNSAVPLEKVQDEVAADPALKLSGGASISSGLSNLLRDEKVQVIPGPVRQAGGRTYYTIEGGPQEVLPDVMVVSDLRTHVILEFYRESGGIPFTTHALRVYAHEHYGHAFKDDRPWSWTNHLQLLMRSGDVKRVGQRRLRAVRWALAAEWDTLPREERERRLADPLLDGLGDTRSKAERRSQSLSVTVTTVSRNDQLSKLVVLTIRELASKETDPSQAEILSYRPVTAAQVREFVRSHGGDSFAGVLESEVPIGLRYAAAARAGTDNPALVAVGTVGDRKYYHVNKDPRSVAYLEYLRTAREYRAWERQHPVDELIHALTLSSAGVLPVGSCIEQARIASLRRVIRRWQEKLTDVKERTPLLMSEVREAEKWQRSLEQGYERLSAWQAPSASVATSGVEDSASRVDIARASQELQSLVGMRLKGPRLVQGRLQAIRALKTPPDDSGNDQAAGGRGRPVENYWERVSYAGYTLGRWGGPRVGAIMTLAAHVAGDLRTPEPFIQTLQWDAPDTHPGAAAVLGMFDDTTSRDALAEYLREAMRSEGTGGADRLAAMEIAVLGLARLPVGGVAQGLRDEEEEVLQAIADSASDARLRDTAEVVLRAWREQWDREALLDL